MKTIYKYPTGSIQIPKGARVLTAGCQSGEFYIWAEVDTEAPLEDRKFVVYGTGWEISEDKLSYVSTVFEHVFVWHVYEVLKGV